VLRETMSAPIRASELARYQQTIDGVRATLGTAGFATARALGRTLSLEQVLVEAFANVDTPACSTRHTGRGGSATSRNGPSRNLALTSRQRQVAQFLAARLTNHEIAVRLHIGPRTVETHVSHILAKLGVSSRHEVTEQLAAQRPSHSGPLS